MCGGTLLGDPTQWKGVPQCVEICFAVLCVGRRMQRRRYSHCPSSLARIKDQTGKQMTAHRTIAKLCEQMECRNLLKNVEDLVFGILGPQGLGRTKMLKNLSAAAILWNCRLQSRPITASDVVVCLMCDALMHFPPSQWLSSPPSAILSACVCVSVPVCLCDHDHCHSLFLGISMR